jgi:hypothetical protein
MKSYIVPGTVGGACFGSLNSAGSELQTLHITDSGYVGIGTNNPATTLHVHGGNVGSFVAVDTFSIENQCGYQFFRAGSHLGSIYYNVSSNGVMRFYLPATGDVFHLGSDSNAWLKGVLTQGSDITLKKNVEVLPYGLDTISRLNPVTYHFNQQDDSDKKHFGLIAQEVQQILPELVSTGDDGKLSLSYIELVPVLINAVKEQQQTISEQSRTIQDLTSRLSRVESLLSQLIR